MMCFCLGKIGTINLRIGNDFMISNLWNLKQVSVKLDLFDNVKINSLVGTNRHGVKKQIIEDTVDNKN